MDLKAKLGRLQLGSRPAPTHEPQIAYDPEYAPRASDALRAEQTTRAAVAGPGLGAGAEDETSASAEGGARAGDERLARVGALRAQLATLRLRSPAVSGGLRVKDAAERAFGEPRAPVRSFAEALLDDSPRMPARGFAQPSSDAPPRVPARPETRVPGEQVDTPYGALFRTVVTHEIDHRHGHADVARAAGVRGSEAALLALDPSLAHVDFARALYIDTETTGLAGGAGTLPFLIGMAWFEEGRLVVEQLLLPRPGHEVPMLERLAERLAAASTIVSYNGKSFDWPLLRTRFVLNRIATPALPGHLDLLHCARRVYKQRLGSVRLVHLEQELLGFERIDDLPGELIPERYFAFLRGMTDGASLLPILDHNRSDLVALPALLGELARRFALEPGGRQHAHDQLGFARVAARGAEAERAIALAQSAVEADLRGELTAHALYLVGELQLRRGALDAAIEAFEQSVETSIGPLDRARAHLALAKLHEHKTKCCARALAHASHTAPCEGESAGARRMARLRERLARQAAREN